jgi:uncharacterized protein YdhG (YjbR/CyaY superfamily)
MVPTLRDAVRATARRFAGDGYRAAMTVIDDHLRRFDGEQAASLHHLRDTIRSILPDAEETISYGMPTFKIGGTAVAGFDGFARHCSYFPHSSAVLERVGDLPEWCEVSKGTLRFPIGRQLPEPLVRRLVDTRLAEIADTADRRHRHR